MAKKAKEREKEMARLARSNKEAGVEMSEKKQTTMDVVKLSLVESVKK